MLQFLHLQAAFLKYKHCNEFFGLSYSSAISLSNFPLVAVRGSRPLDIWDAGQKPEPGGLHTAHLQRY